MFNLYFVTISDLIRREDIHKLQAGIKYLLKKRTLNRFLTAPNGLEELCKKIDQMDSTLLCWYETTDCGIFEFQNHPLEKSIDYFTLKICNINSGYLSLQFNIYLSELKMEELNSLISCNYKAKRGFAVQSLTKKSNVSGAYKNYLITHYNDNYLKTDKIYEFINKIEWKFLQNLYDYKHEANDIHLSMITVLISAITLFFVIFPEKTSFVADLIIKFFTIILK